MKKMYKVSPQFLCIIFEKISWYIILHLCYNVGVKKRQSRSSFSPCRGAVFPALSDLQYRNS